MCCRLTGNDNYSYYITCLRITYSDKYQLHV